MQARGALKGHWLISILVSLVAGIFSGGGGSAGAGTGTSSSSTTMPPTTPPAGTDYGNIPLPSESIGFLSGFIGILLVVIVLAILVGAMLRLGEKNYYIKLLRGQATAFRDVFSRKSIFLKAAGMSLLVGLVCFLWALLLLVPGIMASYSYAMAEYLMAENPDISIGDAMEESKRMMYGHRWELFVLQLSFIGWEILGCLTLGIGLLFVTPYVHATEAAFFLNLKGEYARNLGSYPNNSLDSHPDNDPDNNQDFYGNQQGQRLSEDDDNPYR